MYNASERRVSADRLELMRDLNAVIKYWNVSEVNVSPFNASNHFLITPETKG